MTGTSTRTPDLPQAVSAAAPAPVHDGRRALPLASWVALVLALAIVIPIVTLVGQGWWGARSALLTAAARGTVDVSTLVNEKARSILLPAESSLRLLTFDAMSQARNVSERFQRLPVLVAVLNDNPLVNAIYFGYRNGDFFLVRPLDTPSLRERFRAPDRATFLVQSVERGAVNGNGITGRWWFLNGALEEIEVRGQPDYQFDPRTRDWYRQALEGGGRKLSDPYLFFTTQQTGLTISELTTDGRGVVGVDVTLADLNAELALMRYTPGTEIAVVDHKLRVMAYTDTERHIRRGPDGVQFTMLDDLNAPSLKELARLDPNDRKATEFAVDGRRWIGIRYPLDVLDGASLRILVAVPESDLLAEIQQSVLQQGGVALLLIALMLPLGWWAAKRLGGSVAATEALLKNLAAFELNSVKVPPPSHVSEADSLAISAARAAQAMETYRSLMSDVVSASGGNTRVGLLFERLRGWVEAEQGAIYLHSRTDERLLRLVHVPSGLPAGDIDGRLSEAITPDIARAWCEDGSAEPAQSAPVLLGVPLIARRGRSLGVLVLTFRSQVPSLAHQALPRVQSITRALESGIEHRQALWAHQQLIEVLAAWAAADGKHATSSLSAPQREHLPMLAAHFASRLSNDRATPFRRRWNGWALHRLRVLAWLRILSADNGGRVEDPERRAAMDEFMQRLDALHGVTFNAQGIEQRILAVCDAFLVQAALARAPGAGSRGIVDVLRALVTQAADGHLCVATVRYFLTSGLWLDHARTLLPAHRVDTVDVSALEALLPIASDAERSDWARSAEPTGNPD